MSDYDNTNKGAMFPNRYKEDGDKRPDHTGNLDVDGKEYKGGEFLPNGTLNNFREVSQQFANNKIKMPDDSEMRKTTWKMKNHGFLRPRRETERSRSTPV